MSTPSASLPAIRFQNVWKRFPLEAHQNRSLTDLIQRPFRRKPGSYFWPLKDVTFDVPWGSAVGILGENGSGKSTVLKLITRILEPTYGKVEVFGQVAALLELGAGFHPELTGRENIFLAASMANITRHYIKHQMEEIVDFADIGPYIDVPVKHYSSGMYVRLGFAIAIQLRPQILLLDEVLAVGDEAFQHKCLQSLKHLQREGATFVLVSHGMDQIADMCDQAIWLHDARIQSIGAPRYVIADYLAASAAEEQARQFGEPATQTSSPDGPGTHRYERGAPSPEARRWGTGDVLIQGVRLFGPDNRVATVFEPEHSMRIEFDYSIKRTGLPGPLWTGKPAFGIAIYRLDGTWCYGTNTALDGVEFSADSLSPAATVVVDFPSLQLLHGDYTLDVAIHDPTGDITYDYIRDAMHFKVRNTRQDQGVFRPRLTWSVCRPRGGGSE